MIADLSVAYGALPYPGSVLEQPYALISVGKVLRAYARAWAAVQQDEKHATPATLQWVQKITAASVLERTRGNEHG